jgi:hypothetical protein
MKKGNLVTLVILAALGAFLLYSTLASQSHECEVTVEFRGRTNSAKASAASEGEATRNAIATACGPITGGMDETIACGKVVPVKKVCKTI